MICWKVAVIIKCHSGRIIQADRLEERALWKFGMPYFSLFPFHSFLRKIYPGLCYSFSIDLKQSSDKNCWKNPPKIRSTDAVEKCSSYEYFSSFLSFLSLLSNLKMAFWKQSIRLSYCPEEWITALNALTNLSPKILPAFTVSLVSLWHQNAYCFSLGVNLSIQNK